MNYRKDIFVIISNIISNIKIPLLTIFYSLSEIGTLSFSISCAYLISLLSPRIEDSFDNKILNSLSKKTNTIHSVFVSHIYTSIIITIVLIFFSLILGGYFKMNLNDFLVMIILIITLKTNPILTSHFKFTGKEFRYSKILFLTNIFLIALFFIFIDYENIIPVLFCSYLISNCIYLFFEGKNLKWNNFNLISLKDLIYNTKQSLLFNSVKFFGDQGVIFLSGIFLSDSNTGVISISRTLSMPLRAVQTYYQNKLYKQANASNNFLRKENKKLFGEFHIFQIIGICLILVGSIIYLNIFGIESQYEIIILLTIFLSQIFLNSFRINIDIIINKYKLYPIRTLSALARIISQFAIILIFPNVYGLVTSILIATIIQRITFDRKIYNHHKNVINDQ